MSQNYLGNFSPRGGRIVITFNGLKIIIILSAVKVAVSHKRCPGAVGG